ncbi:TDP-N-acetylfucosamine:lipid II N-acetylfucosaminyltransferase [Cycloclasticus pugetii]|jgi:hypothetical protein|uniref:TDP-N-acetylfucosamine:lipid II N-acetylfucosaminyltransferase n=1 Tax=Cycloclasticus pugetii TaxID=34068 RepID=UPI0009106807|nr:TDP-N-acetylfucosamine:lipid II N-acetylfucosaminyltransferase [Cycloclasticus pugetii]SHJ54301.1 4-alpha-L-fucosyltransferase glycosyl transferase group 56 [Cycloclasticus pugetii]
MTKILHICPLDKFIPPFIDFIEENFTFSKHEFRVFGKMGAYYLKPRPNIHIAKIGFLGRVKAYSQLIVSMHQAEKIILHGLFIPPVVKILWAMPWLLKKCYWVMWGADLYVYSLGEKNKEWKKNEFFRRPVIRNMGVIVSMVKGNYKLAQNWYRTGAKYIYSFIYLSNLYKEFPGIRRKSPTKIMIGNSADPSNNHIEIFNKIKVILSGDYQIIVPLSYGDFEYAQKVISAGEKMFGKRLCPMVDFITYDEYMGVLKNIDIAIYNHERSQGLGNITDLLGFGAKVYIRSDTTTWEFLHNKGLDVFDYLNIDNAANDLMEVFDSDNNNKVMKETFTRSELIRQWTGIFNA